MISLSVELSVHHNEVTVTNVTKVNTTVKLSARHDEVTVTNVSKVSTYNE